MNEIDEAIERLTVLIDTVPEILENRNEEDFALQPWLGMWSKKQMLGHLIDRAAITHQRIIRMQYENDPVIFYNRKRWMELQQYNSADSNDLIQLWKWYNKHLLHIIKNISFQDPENRTVSKSGDQSNLKLLVKGYVYHVENDLVHIFGEQILSSNLR